MPPVTAPLTVFHKLLHPHLHLLRHIHLRPLNLTVGAWQLVLWAAMVPGAWLLYRYVYRRQSGHRRMAWVMFASVVVFQAAAYTTFAIWRNADLLLVLLWASLLALLAGAALLPSLRIGTPRQPGPAQG
ncbi:MAG TPA: hypothetical protein VGY97_13690 [Solirubrobacteraceae bacterium]|jgi:hypothetical protein|nr:hypothetical protein [Solirubrobacteraceae bacterium]